MQETRADYAKKKGKIVVLKCDKCQIESQFHINDFTAKNRNLRALSWAVLFIGYTLMFIPILIPDLSEYLYTMLMESKGRIVILGLIPSTVFGIIQASAVRSERAYNTYKVKQ